MITPPEPGGSNNDAHMSDDTSPPEVYEASIFLPNNAANHIDQKSAPVIVQESLVDFTDQQRDELFDATNGASDDRLFGYDHVAALLLSGPPLFLFGRNNREGKSGTGWNEAGKDPTQDVDMAEAQEGTDDFGKLDDMDDDSSSMIKNALTEEDRKELPAIKAGKENQNNVKGSFPSEKGLQNNNNKQADSALVEGSGGSPVASAPQAEARPAMASDSVNNIVGDKGARNNKGSKGGRGKYFCFKCGKPSKHHVCDYGLVDGEINTPRQITTPSHINTKNHALFIKLVTKLVNERKALTIRWQRWFMTRWGDEDKVPTRGIHMVEPQEDATVGKSDNVADISSMTDDASAQRRDDTKPPIDAGKQDQNDHQGLHSSEKGPQKKKKNSNNNNKNKASSTTDRSGGSYAAASATQAEAHPTMASHNASNIVGDKGARKNGNKIKGRGPYSCGKCRRPSKGHVCEYSFVDGEINTENLESFVKLVTKWVNESETPLTLCLPRWWSMITWRNEGETHAQNGNYAEDQEDSILDDEEAGEDNDREVNKLMSED